MKNPDVFIFDIDGTVSNSAHRVHFVLCNPRKWKEFFAGQEDDPPHIGTCHIAKVLYSTGHRILFFSARSEEHREVTIHWIQKWIFPELPEWKISKMLTLRKSKDRTNDNIIKKQWIQDFHKENPDNRILGIFEDRPRIIRMYRRLGYTVFDPGTWKTNFWERLLYL